MSGRWTPGRLATKKKLPRRLVDVGQPSLRPLDYGISKWKFLTKLDLYLFQKRIWQTFFTQNCHPPRGVAILCKKHLKDIYQTPPRHL